MVDEIINAINNCEMTIQFGGDPEFFIFNKKSKKIVSSDIIIKQGKKSGLSTDDYGIIRQKNICINDGVQGELNFGHSGCRDSAISNIRQSLGNCLLNIGDKYKISVDPIIKMSKTELKKLSKGAKEFGCEPDFNAYNSGEANVKDFNGSELNVRFAGGHIHLGFSTSICEKIHSDKGIEITKLLDRMVGLVLTSFLHSKNEKTRRLYYGQAGDYRIPSYGIEYRTLSSMWLIHPAVTSLVYGLAKTAARIYICNQSKKIIDMFADEEVQHIINKCDVKRAKTIIKRMDKYLFIDTKNWLNPLPNTKTARIIFQGLQKYGIETIFGTDVYKNWGIELHTDNHNRPAIKYVGNDGKLTIHDYSNGFQQSAPFMLKRIIELGGI